MQKGVELQFGYAAGNKFGPRRVHFLHACGHGGERLMSNLKTGLLRTVAGLACGSLVGFAGSAVQATTLHSDPTRTVSYFMSGGVPMLPGGPVTPPQFNFTDSVTSTSPVLNDVVSLSKVGSQSLSGLSGASASISANAALGKIGVSGQALAAATTPGVHTVAGFNVFAGFSDTWTVTSSNAALMDGTHHVVIHSMMSLDGSLDANASGSVGVPGTLETVDSSAELGLFVEGTGLGIHNMVVIGGRGAIVSGDGAKAPLPDFDPPTELDVTIDAILGVAMPVSFGMTIFGGVDVENADFVNGTSGAASVNGNFSHTLKFEPGMTFTDEAGNPFDGVSLTSGSGFDYANPTFSAAPEPTAWILMIGGFGLMGAQLRRRRHPQVGRAMVALG